MKDSGLEIIICDCGSFEHQAIFWHDPDWSAELYVYIHISTHRNFFKRCWAGLRYIFGHRSCYGEWDQFIFSPESERRLFEYLNQKINKL